MIAILMATYNGEKYITEQIESLLAQTEQNFIIYIRDDCSTDNTYNIIQGYANKYPEKIVISQTTKNTGNAKYNFIQMMIDHKQDYVMLCDQDDIWKNDKIEISLKKMKQMEQEFGVNMPLLVHTDLQVVDSECNVISPSFIEAMNADYSRTQLRQILIQNTLTGCTALYNRALADLLQKEPPYMVMHDWWLILVASAFGKIDSIEVPTINYRQHSTNSIGAKDVRKISYKLNRLLHYQEVKKAIAQTYQQAQSLLFIYDSYLKSEQKELLQKYCSIPLKNKIVRIYTILKLRTFKHGVSRMIAHLLFL